MNLIQLFQKLKNGVRFGADRKEAMRGRILRFIEAEESVRENEFARHTLQGSNIMQYLLKPIPMPIFAIITILALLGGGTSFAAESALPGDVLYPVKVHVNENVVEALSFSNEAKAGWESALAERRLDEAAELAAKGHISAETKAQLEHDFDAHAEKAKSKIHDIEAEGHVSAAAAAASHLEGLLKAHEVELGDIEAESSSTEEKDEVRPLRLKVQLRLEDVSRERDDLESKVSAQGEGGSDAKAEVKTAAEGKLNAAANVIASSRSFIESRKDKVGAQAVADAEARLKAAENLVAQGNAKVQAGEYGDAFSLGNKAIRVAEEAKFLVKVNGDLNLNIRIGHEDNDEGADEAESTSTTETEVNEGGQEQERGVQASSSVDTNTNVDEGRAESHGELKVKVGL